MKLEELKKMIKEEFDAFMEAEDTDDVSVDVDSDEMDGGDSGDSMETLRKIYDMLKPMFDGEEMGDEEGAEDEPDMDEDMMDEVKDSDEKNEAADVEEAASTGFGDAGAKNTSGKDAGYTPAKTTRGDGKLHEGMKRLQKLANIIK
jgi:hypothetical protein